MKYIDANVLKNFSNAAKFNSHDAKSLEQAIIKFSKTSSYNSNFMHDYKNHKPAEPSNIKEMVMAGLAFIVTMALLAGVLAVWSVV